MINVGVVGFGNLGKAVIKQLKNNKMFNLIAVFSQRDIAKTVPFYKILDYKDKIDLLFLCGGSYSDLESQSHLIKSFNTIDCYDNHNKLKQHVLKIDDLARKNKKIAICSVGWDPGLFSLMRSLFFCLNQNPYTFWGKGTSQGHTQAIKKIIGVKDAIQFTIPNQEAIEKIKAGKIVDNNNLHKRECYVVCDKKDEERIKNTIVNMPDYFSNYKTHVYFVSQKKLNQLKSFSHKGEIVVPNNIINFSLNLPSNPNFTANVMISYARCFLKLKQQEQFGAHTILDIPISYIMNINKFQFL